MVTALALAQGGAPPLAASWREHRARARAFESYTYAYPHKTAYRMLERALPLDEVWRDDDRSSLFLYVHVPFCEMRCGFCNLFTRVEHAGSVVDAYLDALERQADVVGAALDDAGFARVAFGGGTPTHMTPAQLARMLAVVERFARGAMGRVPLLFETSPGTATADRLGLLCDAGAHRISIGVQSFDDDELAALGRPSTGAEARAALERIRATGAPVVNVDLIYGIEGQSPGGFVRQIDEALRFLPEELFLYPLYVRPLTGLGRQGRAWDDERLELYRAGRARLLERGYRQLSLRLFRREGAPALSDPPYRCQDDGMVGLGCGARSYTRALHYSDEWAVSKGGVRAILDEWMARPAESFASARYGFVVDEGEQRARWLLQSLLLVEGVERAAFAARFGLDVLAAFPQLGELDDDGLLALDDERCALTEAGLELSDCVGPWLWSDAVRARMREYELR